MRGKLIDLRYGLKQVTKIFSLAILQRLKACYDSDYNGGTTSNPALVFQCTKSCLARCLAHHNYNFPQPFLI